MYQGRRNNSIPTQVERILQKRSVPLKTSLRADQNTAVPFISGILGSNIEPDQLAPPRSSVSPPSSTIYQIKISAKVLQNNKLPNFFTQFRGCIS